MTVTGTQPAGHSAPPGRLCSWLTSCCRHSQPLWTADEPPGAGGMGRERDGRGTAGDEAAARRGAVTDRGPTPAAVRTSLHLVTSIPRSSTGPALHEHTRRKEETHISNARALPGKSGQKSEGTGRSPASPPRLAHPLHRLARAERGRGLVQEKIVLLILKISCTERSISISVWSKLRLRKVK